MKRTERHHLKENELAAWVADIREWIRGHGRSLVTILAVLIVLAAATGGFLLWQARVSAEAAAKLTEAAAVMQAPVVPPPPQTEGGTVPPAVPGSYASAEARLEAALPKFLAVAEQYPNTQAGLAARYQAAGALVSLGRYEEADRQYQQVIDTARGSVYGQMAELGLADAAVHAGRYDRAIEVYRGAAGRAGTDLPIDAVLLQLGHTYASAGKAAEARQTFTRIVDEFPQSLYVAEARRELEKLKVTGS